MSDQDRISPYNQPDKQVKRIKKNINKGKKLIQNQILWTNIRRIAWQKVRRRSTRWYWVKGVRAKFLHNPILHHASIYEDLLFSAKPIRCACIMKYGLVRKFFRGKSRLSSLVINIWSTSQSIGNIKNFLHVYLLLRTAGWAFVLVAGFFTNFTSFRLHISLLIHHKDDWKDKILWRNHAWCQNTLSVFSSPGSCQKIGYQYNFTPSPPL